MSYAVFLFLISCSSSSKAFSRYRHNFNNVFKTLNIGEIQCFSTEVKYQQIQVFLNPQFCHHPYKLEFGWQITNVLQNQNTFYL